MKPKINFRSLLTALTLCATTFAAVMLVPAGSLASQSGLHAEERAAHAEERAQERATRTQEREARQAAHREEREARQNARKSRREESYGETSETGAGMPPAGPGARPSNKTDRECRPTIQASSTHITADETVTISGTLGCPTDTGTTEQTPNSAAEQPVMIYQRQTGAGAESFAAIGAATPEADGSFTLTSPALNTNTVFKVREGRHAAHVVIEVAPLVTLTISTPDASSSDSKVPKHPKITFTGTVNPVNTGALVALQVASAGAGEQWRPVAFGRVAADGSYSIDHTFRVPSQVSIRAVVHGKRLNVAGVSEVLSYSASQPQNPQLTIQTSTDPVSSGAAITISGVVAGATNKPVKLLARTAGSGYAVVAETNTGAEGDYTFTQTPLQNTYYVVSDTAARSTPLFEGVALALTTEAPPSAVLSGQQLTFSGTVPTAPTGQLVYLEREYASGLGFHVIGATPVNASSQFTIAHTFASTGPNVLRIKVPGNAQHLPSVSAQFTVTVTG